jgi:hypothetical protein
MLTETLRALREIRVLLFKVPLFKGSADDMSQLRGP